MIAYLLIGFGLAFIYTALTTPNTNLETYLILQFIWPLVPVIIVWFIYLDVKRIINKKHKINGVNDE